MTSIAAINIAFSMDFTSRARTVFLYLAKLSNTLDTCFPSIETIVTNCKLSESTVKRAIADLLAMGILSKQTRHRKDKSQTSNLYHLHIVELSKSESTDRHGSLASDVERDTPDDTLNPPPTQTDPPGGSEIPPLELDYNNLSNYSLTDRHAHACETHSAQKKFALTAAEEKTLEEILDRCELSYLDPAYQVMFHQAVVQLYFSESIRVGGAKLPQQWVRQCLGHLGYHVLEAAKNKLEHNPMGEVRDSGAYVRAVVFNCIMELESDLLRWRSVG